MDNEDNGQLAQQVSERVNGLNPFGPATLTVTAGDGGLELSLGNTASTKIYYRHEMPVSEYVVYVVEWLQSVMRGVQDAPATPVIPDKQFDSIELRGV